MNTKHPLTLYAFILIYFATMSTLALWKYWGYKHSIFDIGTTVQPIWSFLEVGTPISTTAPPYEKLSRFGYHFSPIILLLIPIYKIFGAEGLIVSHVFFISLTALIIFKIAKKLNFNQNQSSIFAAIFLLNPGVVNAIVWDFRVSSIGCLLVTYSFLCIVNKNFFHLLTTCIFLLCVKENYGAYVAGFGLIWTIYHKEHSKGFGLFTFGLAAAAAIVLFIMPYLYESPTHPMVGNNDFADYRYAWIFANEEDRNTFIRLLFVEDLGLYTYLFIIFGCFLFIPLLSITFVIPAGGDLVLAILSNTSLPRSIYSYHTLPIVPCLLVASMIFIANHNKKQLIKAMLMVNLLLFYFISPFPLPGAKNVWKDKKIINFFDENIDEIKEIVGASPVCAQKNVGGYFVERLEIYPYPECEDRGRFYIFHTYKPSYNDKSVVSMPSGTLEKFENNSNFDLVYDKDAWKVFKRKN